MDSSGTTKKWVFYGGFFAAILKTAAKHGILRQFWKPPQNMFFTVVCPIFYGGFKKSLQN